jgi:hypothetical protein
MDEDSCLTGLTNLYIDFEDIDTCSNAGFIMTQVTHWNAWYNFLYYGGDVFGGYRDLVILSVNTYRNSKRSMWRIV